MFCLWAFSHLPFMFFFPQFFPSPTTGRDEGPRKRNPTGIGLWLSPYSSFVCLYPSDFVIHLHSTLLRPFVYPFAQLPIENPPDEFITAFLSRAFQAGQENECMQIDFCPSPGVVEKVSGKYTRQRAPYAVNMIRCNLEGR